MKTLPKNYDHKEREAFWQQHWVDNGTYHFRDDLPREQTFVIDTPPPTVSGILHMGHIFSYTQADFIARYQRMSGRDVFYPMGFDDNGLPTERLVEKTKKVRGSAMPRADFVALCREVVKDAEDEFRRLFKSAALSVDWRQEYQTISDNCRQLSQASFVDLMKKGHAYRDFRPTYWDWVDQTAIASAEIEEKEMPGYQCTIPFGLMDAAEWDKLANSSEARPSFDSLEKVQIMTTRPELLGACVALMCHPDDEAKFKHKVAISPLYHAVVPIAFDEKVDKEKGTGFVMCCSWGDDTDKEWIQKHNLAWRPHLNTNGRLALADKATDACSFVAGRDGAKLATALTNTNCLDITKAVGVYEALEGSKLIRDIKNENSAKGKALKLLDEAGLLLPMGEKAETIIHKVQMVKCAERSGTAIEIIPTYQWFVRIVDKKDALLAKGAECGWHPEYMKIRLNQWIEGLKEDWCISRQRFFGVPFPVWYSKRAGEEGKILFADFDQLPVDPMVDLPKGYKREEVEADQDVMDTWATSSISPQLNSRGICSDFALDAKRHAKIFPADLRPQAHEIIRTWAFYTIVKAHLHQNTIPWKNVMISGWCLASDKTKMSKSKGNVVTPVGLIEDKGSDAVRYWASTSRLGADTAFSEDLLKIGRKLVTKLWNASNFASLNLSKLEGAPSTAAEDTSKGIITEALDVWILSRLNQCIKKATEQFEIFEYCDARVAIEDFFWNDFCDNYLELVKARAYGEAADASMAPPSKEAQQSALYTIYHCLDAILRLFAPFIPHVTEELYSHIFDNQYAATGSLHTRGMWPRADAYPYDAQAELSGMACVDVLNVIRKAKSEANVSIKYPVADVQVLAKGDKPSWEHLVPVLSDLKAAGNAQQVNKAAGGHLNYVSDKGWFSVAVTMVKVEEQRRNPDQGAHEKLEGQVLHGPGNPDLSKHVVKVQVNSLSDSLQKQK
jgi:valyl-tRNA synthetase